MSHLQKVGIVPSARLFGTEDIYEDAYNTVNNYGKRVALAGGIPLGIVPVDGVLSEEQLELCDAFVICGGGKIWPYHIQVVEHCVKTGKRLLGICLGMQAIHGYFVAAEEAPRRGWQGSVAELFVQMKREYFMFLHPVEHHWDVHITRGHEEDAKMRVNLEPDSLIARLTGSTALMGASMHRYAVTDPSARLRIAGRSEDGTIEVLEYGENIIGVQFHPEVDNDLLPLFRFVVGP